MAENALSLWSELVAKQPDAVAIYRPDGTMVCRLELDRVSEALAKRWQAEGLKARCILALQMPNAVEWMCAFLACLKVGLVVAPLDPSLDADDSYQLLESIRAQALWDGNRLTFVPGVKPRSFRDVSVELCKLTSGSTGRPKPWFFKTAEMLADARQICATMGIRAEDINLGCIPWGHSYGLGNIVYPLLIQGTATTWTQSPFPADLSETCQRVRATVFPTVPTILRAISRSGIEPDGFESLRLVVSAGARLDPEIARGFHEAMGLCPHNLYGSTETGGICFDRSGEASLSGRSVGQPMQGVRIHTARSGQFYVESAAVSTYGRGKSGRRYLVSDYGALDRQGELVLEKRSKGIVKIGGRRIQLGEVEAQLTALVGIRDACVFAVEQNGEPVLAAAIETDLSVQEARKKLAEKLARRFRPKQLRVMDSLPMTARGKVDLKRIQSIFGAN